MVSLRSKGPAGNSGLPARKAITKKAPKAKQAAAKKALKKPKDLAVRGVAPIAYNRCLQLLPLTVFLCCCIPAAQLPEWFVVLRKGATTISPEGDLVPILQASWARRKPGKQTDFNNWLEVAFYTYNEYVNPNRWETMGGKLETAELMTVKIADLEEMKPPGAKSKYHRLPAAKETGNIKTLPRPGQKYP